MFNVIDRYILNLYCRCADCENFKPSLIPHSCLAYPVRDGIPPKVWNGKYTECEHFIPKENKNEIQGDEE